MAQLGADVTDLNALLKPRRKVHFGNITYEVPGDMPMDVYLRMQAAFANEDDAEGAQQLRQAFVDLLTFYTPDDQARRVTVENELRPLGVRTIILLLNAVYKDADNEEEDNRAEGESSSAGEASTEGETPTTTGTSSSEPSPTPNSQTEPETAQAG